MRFKFHFTLLIVCILVTGTSSAQSVGLTAKWQEESYLPYKNIPRTNYWYDGEEQIMYLVTNDEKNVYLHMRAMNQRAIRKVLDFGFTVWIDIKGKNKKKSGIVFPISRKERAPQIQMKEQSKEGERSPRKQGEKREELPPIEHRFEMKLINLKGIKKEEIIYADGVEGVSGEISYNEEKELEYHLKIPLESIGVFSLKERFITFNLESGSLSASDQPERGQEGGGRGGPPGNGGGRRGGGGRPGGGGDSSGNGGGPQGRNAKAQYMTSPIKIKIKKVRLNKGL